MESNRISSQITYNNVTIVTQENSVEVTQPTTRVIEVNTLGPRGPQGPSGSSTIFNYKIVSSSYNINNNDEVIEVIEANTTQSLLTSVNNLGKNFIIINSSSGSIMVLANGSETIGNNYLNNESFLIISEGNVCKIISNNINWRVI
jgi:hypothetical protein